MADIIRYTSCGYHCNNECILKVRVRGGRVTSVEPDDSINSGIPREDACLSADTINKGMVQSRPCAKGYAQAQNLYDPNRLKYPMKRAGQRGEGLWQRISWDEALDTVAAKLVQVKRDYGPYSILHHPYSNMSKSSFPIGPWFAAGVCGWDSHSSNGWTEPKAWVLGRYNDRDPGSFQFQQDEGNLFKSRLIVLWGFNPMITMNGAWGYTYLRVKEHGIPIICIESRYTPTAEVLADQWIPIRPTTDAAMMIAIANVWFKEDLCDNEFIAKYVEPDGLARWKSYVLGTSDGTDKTPEWAEEICGVPAETIREFSRLYARSRPVNLNVSVSIGRQFYGENPARASMYLQALSGNMCIPGGTAAAETGLPRGVTTLPIPKVDWQRQPGVYNAPVLYCGFKWQKSIELRQNLDKGILSKDDYNRRIGNSPRNPAPNIKMVILESNNHPSTMPDINANIRALKMLDFYIVFSHYAETTAARYADILLPQIASAFEGRHCVCPLRGTDLFKSGRHLTNFMLYRQKCTDPPGEIKSGDWFWVQIARRLGLAELFSPRMVHVSDVDWDDTIELLHKEAYEKWAVRKEVARLHPPSWDDFQKRSVFRWEMGAPQYPGQGDIEKGLNPFRGTPSGKIEFHSEKLAKGPEFLGANEYYPGKCFGGGRLPPSAQMTFGGKDTFYSADTKKHPLLMSSPHSYYRTHSLFDSNPWLRDCYRHAVWMNVADARVRGIKDNEKVRVFNDIGEMVLPAHVTSRIVPGSVVVFHGAWYTPGKEKTALMPEGVDVRGSPNILTHNEDLPDTVIGFLPCKGLVEIQKWEGV